MVGSSSLTSLPCFEYNFVNVPPEESSCPSSPLRTTGPTCKSYEELATYEECTTGSNRNRKQHFLVDRLGESPPHRRVSFSVLATKQLTPPTSLSSSYSETNLRLSPGPLGPTGTVIQSSLTSLRRHSTKLGSIKELRAAFGVEYFDF